MTRPDTPHPWDLFWMLTRTEFRLRDQGTWLGFLWTLLHPLFMFAILHALFTHWMAPRVPHYAAFLLVGIVQWNFFATATSAGLTSLRRKAGLIANFAFPRRFVVLSSVAAVFLSHLLELAVLLAALALLGVRPSASWLLLPAVVAVELAWTTGAACLLSVCAVDLRDLDRAWGIFLYGLFFMTPVFYTREVVGPAAARLLDLNPVGVVIEATRGLLIEGSVAAAGPLAAAAAGSAVCCAAGLAFFERRSRGIAERL